MCIFTPAWQQHPHPAAGPTTSCLTAAAGFRHQPSRGFASRTHAWLIEQKATCLSAALYSSSKSLQRFLLTALSWAVQEANPPSTLRHLQHHCYLQEKLRVLLTMPAPLPFPTGEAHCAPLHTRTMPDPLWLFHSQTFCFLRGKTPKGLVDELCWKDFSACLRLCLWLLFMYLHGD